VLGMRGFEYISIFERQSTVIGMFPKELVCKLMLRKDNLFHKIRQIWEKYLNCSWDYPLAIKNKIRDFCREGVVPFLIEI